MVVNQNRPQKTKLVHASAIIVPYWISRSRFFAMDGRHIYNPSLAYGLA
jgi:hypothetical protein